MPCVAMPFLYMCVYICTRVIRKLRSVYLKNIKYYRFFQILLFFEFLTCFFFFLHSFHICSNICHNVLQASVCLSRRHLPPLRITSPELLLSFRHLWRSYCRRETLSGSGISEYHSEPSLDCSVCGQSVPIQKMVNLNAVHHGHFPVHLWKLSLIYALCCYSLHLGHTRRLSVYEFVLLKRYLLSKTESLTAFHSRRDDRLF